MILVSVLCHLGRRVIIVMVFLWTWAVSPLMTWLWRRLAPYLRHICVKVRPVLSRVYMGALGSKQHREEPREGPREEPTGGTRSLDIEGSQPGDQSVQGSAGSNPEPGVSGAGGFESPGYEEDQEVVDEDELDTFRADPSDEFYCGYDSTWESEGTSKPDRTQPGYRHAAFRRFEDAARDMYNYRHDYPERNQFQCWGQPESDDMPNLKFYLGERPSQPDGVYINSFHNDWQGDYVKLERVHSYIQWLFPLQEPGMNFEAIPMTRKEVMAFCENSHAKENLLKSYKLMLDFYGIELCDEETGKVQRASNWKSRFSNLNSRGHNNLRLTRILKCLGTLGYEHYQAPLVRFFLKETLQHGELPNVKTSVLNYFVFAVRNKRQRKGLVKFAYLKYHKKEEFVWCPKNIQMMWSAQSIESN